MLFWFMWRVNYSGLNDFDGIKSIAHERIKTKHFKTIPNFERQNENPFTNWHLMCLLPQNPRQRCASFSTVPMDPNVSRERRVHSVTFAAIGRSCASIGCVVCVKRAINASSCTNTTWPRCRSVTSIRASMPATTKNARSCTSIQRAKSKTVHGMIAAFVGTGPTVAIGISVVCCAQTT